MKKLLLLSAVFLMGAASTFAQFANIGIVGGSTPVGWDQANAIAMTTTNGVNYTYSGLVVTVPGSDAGVKFVQDNAWTVNWGAATFPNGMGAQNGPNIPATNGTWDVTLNISTGAYTFVPTGSNFDTVTIGDNTMDVEMATANGINYSAMNVTFTAATSTSFMVNDEPAGWGSISFPAGTATAGGNAIPVPANSYNIMFNRQTGAYDFGFVGISLIGTGVFADDINWTLDLDMETANGIDYTISSFDFPGGEAKFRLNHEWNMAWGSAEFPSGTAVTVDAPNLNITAGTYAVTFNRSTGAYSFNTTAGNKDFNSRSITVYPNPSNNVWNFNAGSNIISSVQIVDVTGKVVYTAAVNAAAASVNASGFASGMYFARLTSGNATETVRVVKN